MTTTLNRPKADTAIGRRGSMRVAATFTVEPLQPSLQFILGEADLALDVFLSPYHQVLQELISSSSALSTNDKGVNVILVRLEDFVREIPDQKDARALIDRSVEELLDALAAYSSRVSVPTIVGVLGASPSVTGELLPAIESANSILCARANLLPGISLLTDFEVDRVSAIERYDSVSDALAHIPFTDEHYAALALAIARKTHAILVPARKVLVLDCDNTIWQGVVGEDGVDGIKITNAFEAVQRFAAQVQAQGGLVCLVSKNSEQDVLEVFDRRPEMPLKINQIVAHRINWSDKAQNIASLAQALNLGLESFVFIDDNPVECELVQMKAPQVLTLLLPPEGEIESFLTNLWVFDKVAVTAEDSRRTTMYVEDLARKQLERSATDISDFIANLNVQVDIRSPEEADWSRVAQLTQRTNQFNFSTVRRTESELRTLHTKGCSALCVKVRDRFGDYGLVGLVILRPQLDEIEVDTFLLSCRVLGRGVEHAILRKLGDVAIEKGVDRVALPYIRSNRNEPARAFAESVAARFGTENGDQHVYRIPATEVVKIVHQPGQDPEAVIKARDSENNKTVAQEPGGNRQNAEIHRSLSQLLTSGQEVLKAMHSKNARKRTLPVKSVKPANESESEMLGLWREVLNIDDIGVDDDYFAIGGTSLVAAKMFAEIRRRFNVALPLTSILEFPTVRKLCQLIDSEQRHSRTLVELRRGGDRHFFFVHDGDGESLLYSNIARRLPSEFAVFGIEPPHALGMPFGHSRMEELAAFYNVTIRKKQPHGPYLLGGMCAGGVIAHEMARQLEEAGEAVELVVLLDAAAPLTAKRQGRVAKHRMERLTGVIASGQNVAGIVKYAQLGQTILRKLTNALVWEIHNRLWKWSVKARFRLLRMLLKHGRRWPRIIPSLHIRQTYESLEANFIPAPLSSSSVLLVRALAGTEENDAPFVEVYADDTLGWKNLAADLIIVDVKGGHFTMLQEPFAGAVAEVIYERLRRNIDVGNEASLRQGNSLFQVGPPEIQRAMASESEG